MKTQNSIAKKRATRHFARHQSGHNEVDLPRLYLFLELFVDKAIPACSDK
jgi:hypothetical protein